MWTAVPWRGRIRQACWAVVLVAMVLAVLSPPAQAQQIRPFTRQFTDNKRGDIYIIGNTLFSCIFQSSKLPLERIDASSPELTTEDVLQTPRAVSTCDPNIAIKGSGSVDTGSGPQTATGIYLSDQGYQMRPINLATQPGTNNSSSATWQLPQGAEVLWAGLYWSGRRRLSGPQVPLSCGNGLLVDESHLCFQTPTSGGYKVKAALSNATVSGPNDVYQSFAEVTQEVHEGGPGTYSVADVEAQQGNDGLGFFAGWALVIVIQDPKEPLRNLTVFNGFAHVDGNNPNGPNAKVSIPVTGFLTPQTGTVATHLGVVSYEGDLGATGDTIKLNGITLSDDVSPANNFFNSGISRLGKPITNKVPNFINQLGFDIAVVDAPGILPNGASSATFEFSSTSEIYYPGVFTFATDLFLPVVEAVKTVQDVNAGTALPGDILEYTIGLVNIGNDVAVNLVLKDPIPFGATYVTGSMRIKGVPPAQDVVLTDAADADVAEFNTVDNSVVFRLGTGATATTGGSLAPDKSTTVVFRVQINATAAPASIISDQAVATYNSQTLPALGFTALSDSDLDTPGKQPTDVVVGAAIAPLTLSKSAAPDPVRAGQTLTYTFAVTNAGPNTAVNVVLADMTPEHTTFVSATAPVGWTITQQPPVGGTGPIIFKKFLVPPDNQAFLNVLRSVSALPDVSADPLPPGFTIVLLVDPTVQSGTLIDNIATLTSNTGPQSLTKETTVTVIGDSDLSITKTDGQTLTVPRAVLTYTLVVSNAGPSAVTGALVTDLVPATLINAGWTCTASNGSSCPASGPGSIIDVPVNLLVGGTATFTLNATVSPTVQGGTIVNEATVTVPSGTRDPNEGNNTAIDNDTVIAEADIAVFKTVDNPMPVVGNEVTFTVTATNKGPNPATGVKLSDGVPQGLTLLPDGVTTSQGTYTPNTGDWDIGALAVGAQATLMLRVRVEDARRIRNEATKIAGDQFDPDRSNDSSGVDLTNQPSADIRVLKTADTHVLPIGTNVTFTVTVSNDGPSPATGVELTDLLPAGLAFVSATPLQGMYTPLTGVWTIGALAKGAQTTLTLQATVQEAGEFTNRAAKTAQGELDPNPRNDVSGVTVNGEAADVQVVKTVDRTMASVEDTVTFTVTVTNKGPNAVSGVEVLDVLSARLTFDSATTSQGTYTADTGRWSVGALAAVGAAATARLQIKAKVTEAGPLTNLAVKIDQDLPDPNPANDQDSVAPPGLPVADLVVTKSNGADRVVPGTEVVYTVVVTNRGPSPVIGAIVSDPIPLILRDQARGLRSFEIPTWTCVASAGSACPARGEGNVLATVNLLVGGTATFTLGGLVTPTDVGTLVNTATVTAPTGVLDPLPGNNSATDTDLLTPLADLSITKTDEVQSVVPGTGVRYTLVVRNAGPSAVINARVQDPASAALRGVRWTCVASAGSSCPAEGTGPIDTTVNLAPNGIVTFTLTGTVTADAMGMLANTATVTTPSGVTDPEFGNNTVTDTNTVLPSSAFGPPSGRKTVEEDEFPDLKWTVEWLNNPANAAPLRIRVLDRIPVATTYVDGSVTCEARGQQSTVARCDFDAETNQVVYDGIVGPASDAVIIITFQTAVQSGITQEVANQALAHWDATGTGTVDDDISAGQAPVLTGTEFGRSDPTVVSLPPLACLFQQRLLALDQPPPAPAPAAGGSTDSSPQDGQDPGVDSGVDRQNTPGTDGILTLSTPLDGDAVAGTTVTLATLRARVSGTVVSQPIEIRIANAAPAATLDLVENVGSKTERVPARESHNVITANGVVVEFPVTALAAADIVRLERVDPTTAPGQLPGIAVSPLVAVTLAGGRTAFSDTVTLSLPYPDAEPDGLVDGTSPAVPELTLTAWGFNTALGIWVRLPEARVFPAFHEVLVPIPQPGLYGVFQAADGSTGLAGTTGPASPALQSAGAQGSGWQDIGVVTTFPYLVPLNTMTLPNGTYEVRAICAASLADVSTGNGTSPVAVAASVPGTSGVGGGGGGGGGCSLSPGGAWSWPTALAALGNLGVPLVALLLLSLWRWRRPR